MSLTLNKVKQYVEWASSEVDYKRNGVERAERMLKEAEECLEIWKATLEKMETSEN